MKKQLISFILIMVMAFGTTACQAENQGSTEVSSQAGEEIQTLKVAAIETAYGSDIWEKIVESFESANPGVEVNLVIDKKLEDVIGPAMKAGDYPDVIHRPIGGEMALTETFIKERGLEDITDVLSMKIPGENVTVQEKIIPGFLDTSLTMPYGDGKTYLAPMFYSPCGLFYNKGLFEEKGWKVPETWEEMWELGEKAKAEGISLFTYPTTGYFDAFYYALLFEAGGPQFFEKATHYEEGIWDTQEAKTTYDIVEKLASYTEKSVPANANDENYVKNQQLILDNKALFVPNGSWLIGEMKDAPREAGFKWGFMSLPALDAGKDRYSYTFFEQAWIPAAAKNKDLAKTFLAYLYSDEAVGIFYEFSPEDSAAVQPVTGIVDRLTGDNKVYFSIYESGIKPAMGAFATTEPIEGLTVRSVWFDPVNSLVSEDKTTQEWIDGIKEANDKLRQVLK